MTKLHEKLHSCTELYTTVHDVILSIDASFISFNDHGAAARSQRPRGRTPCAARYLRQWV
jgi:hypothetical protein